MESPKSTHDVKLKRLHPLTTIYPPPPPRKPSLHTRTQSYHSTYVHTYNTAYNTAGILYSQRWLPNVFGICEWNSGAAPTDQRGKSRKSGNERPRDRQERVFFSVGEGKESECGGWTNICATTMWAVNKCANIKRNTFGKCLSATHSLCALCPQKPVSARQSMTRGGRGRFGACQRWSISFQEIIIYYEPRNTKPPKTRSTCSEFVFDRTEFPGESKHYTHTHAKSESRLMATSGLGLHITRIAFSSFRRRLSARIPARNFVWWLWRHAGKCRIGRCLAIGAISSCRKMYFIQSSAQAGYN